MTVTTEVLGPLEPDTLRVIFLYVGQGESTLVLAPNGGGDHRSMLIDCNRAEELKGVCLPKLLKDVLPKDGKGKPLLDVFVNTHPHTDHLGGLPEIDGDVTIDAVWHTDHRPSRDHESAYDDLKRLIAKVARSGGAERKLVGTNEQENFGRVSIQFLSPAPYVVEDIAGETAAARDQRIHEHCAVMRVTYGTPQVHVMITGDSDKAAWKRISGYHGKEEDNRTAAHVLSAAHHGSYTFFKDRDDDPDPITDHLDRIAPEHVIISAPDRQDSKHEHPDPYAVERYEKAVGADNVHHMGSRAWSFVVDVFSDGTYQLFSDNGALADRLGFGKDDEPDDKSGDAPPVISRIERSRPMGT
jgi:competence protein ComEC